MKIGIFDPYLNTMSGGEKYILTAAKCLMKSHDVSIFWDISKSDEVKKLALRRFDFNFEGLDFASNIFAKEVPFVTRLVESRKYDLIIYLSDGSIPTVLTDLIIHFQTPVEWVKSNTFKSKIKFMTVREIICNSNFTSKYIDKKFGIKSKVIYPPVSIKKSKTDQKENFILNVGRFGIRNAGSSYKKQDILVEAFKKLIDDGLKTWELHLLISIMEDDSKDIEILENKIGKYPIKIIVNPPNLQLWEEYAKAKIYWHASGYGEDLNRFPDRAEHFGISTAEAMGMGAVPVVINAGGQPEIVKENINGLLWENLEELNKKTTYLIKDTKLLERLSAKAQIDIETFSENNFCKNLNSLIK